MTSLESAVLGDELISTVAALGRLVRRRLRQAVPGPPLRGAQLELMRIIEQQPGVGITPAARILHLAANTVSTLVDQLIDLGMLVRDTDSSDRRVARLWLTETATQRLASGRQARMELMGRVVAGLSAAEREALAQALPTLRALLSSLDSLED